MKFLKGIGSFIANIFKSIFNFIVNIFKGIFNFIKTIIQAIVSVFKKDYPKDGLDLAAIFQAMVVAVITALIIFIFDPFQFSNINQVLIAAGIAFALSLLFSFIASFLFKNAWSLFNQVLKHLILFVLIALACIFYFQKEINAESIGIFVLISMLPSILYIFFNQSIAENKYTNLAYDLNEKLKSTKISSEPSKTVSIQNNKGTNLNLLPNQIISATEKNGNVEITWQNLFSVETTMIQSSLKSVEASIAGNAQFVKCNAKTLVNVYAIKNANGNAHGLKLEIAKSNQFLSVARNKVNLIQNSALGK